MSPLRRRLRLFDSLLAESTYSSLVFRLILAIGGLSTQFCLDKKVEVAVHHRPHIARFRPSPMIFHHLVGLKDIGANLVPPGYIALFPIAAIHLRPLLVLLQLVKLRF